MCVNGFVNPYTLEKAYVGHLVLAKITWVGGAEGPKFGKLFLLLLVAKSSL